MRRLPIGAGVRVYGALAKVVRAPASQKPPLGFTAVVFDGVEGMRLVRSADSNTWPRVMRPPSRGRSAPIDLHWKSLRAESRSQ
jgi:hypothetical protein